MLHHVPPITCCSWIRNSSRIQADAELADQQRYALRFGLGHATLDLG
jgi:hypothetical protein